jgi:copper chaperone CopZ
MAGGDGDGMGGPEPVVLRMELHCAGCAKKVRKSIHHMPGVVSVVADPAANTVVVAGTADPAALKARIESKTKKPVQIVSAGGNSKPPPAGAEPKKPNPEKQQGGGEEKKNPDKGDKAGSAHPEVTKEGKKQPLEEKKPIEVGTQEANFIPTQRSPLPTAVVLKIRLHCDSCADRIRRRIYKIKGVKDVVLEGDGKDEVKVVGTMDVPAMVAYLNDKLNRPVELAAPGSKDPTKARGGDDGHVKKDKGAGDGGHKAENKGKGIEVAGPSVASAAASMAAPAGASTHHVSPYGYGHVAYPQPPQGPPPGYYSNGYYGGGGNADGGTGYANGGGYYQQQPSSDAGGYYQQQPSTDSGGGYYQQQPSAADAGGGYYQEQRGGYYDQPSAGSYYPGGYEQQHPANPPPYQQPYSSAYGFDTAPPTQMFSDENPNSCSLM